MAIRRTDPVLRAIRMHIIKQLRETKFFKEEFDYHSLEWTIGGSVENLNVDLRIRMEENYFWLDFTVNDVDGEFTAVEIWEKVEELLDSLGAEFNDRQKHLDTGEWYLTYSLKFKDQTGGLVVEKLSLLANRLGK
jgi:hypothetical protein